MKYSACNAARSSSGERTQKAQLKAAHQFFTRDFYLRFLLFFITVVTVFLITTHHQEKV
jgi:hypothetical protein